MTTKKEESPEDRPWWQHMTFEELLAMDGVSIPEFAELCRWTVVIGGESYGIQFCDPAVREDFAREAWEYWRTAERPVRSLKGVIARTQQAVVEVDLPVSMGYARRACDCFFRMIRPRLR
jgi:hypothetical protein